MMRKRGMLENQCNNLQNQNQLKFRHRLRFLCRVRLLRRLRGMSWILWHQFTRLGRRQWLSMPRRVLFVIPFIGSIIPRSMTWLNSMDQCRIRRSRPDPPPTHTQRSQLTRIRSLLYPHVSGHTTPTFIFTQTHKSNSRTRLSNHNTPHYNTPHWLMGLSSPTLLHSKLSHLQDVPRLWPFTHTDESLITHPSTMSLQIHFPSFNKLDPTSLPLQNRLVPHKRPS